MKFFTSNVQLNKVFFLHSTVLLIAFTLLTSSCSEKYKEGVIDKKNLLLWQKCPAGSFGDFCQKGMNKRFSWEEAESYCKKLDWGDKKWELPDISSLMTLRKCSDGFKKNSFVSKKICRKQLSKKTWAACKTINKICKESSAFGAACIDTKNFPNTEADGFWSSSVNRSKKDKAWGLSFWEGMAQTTTKVNKIYVRCVSKLKPKSD